MKAGPARAKGWIGDVMAAASLALLLIIPVLKRSEASSLLRDMLVEGGFIVSFSAVGWLLVRRLPGNLIGWSFSVAGLLWGCNAVANAIAGSAVVDSDPMSAAERAWAVMDVNLWILAMPFSVSLPLLLLPTGELLSQRWLPVAWTTVIGTVLGTIGFATEPGTLDEAPFLNVTNPLGLPQLGPLPGAAAIIGAMIVMGSVFAGALAVVLRFRRSRGLERQQMRWVVFGGCLAIIGMAASAGNWVPGSIAKDFATVAGIAAVPVCVGIAVLRYRLYDLGRLVSRTVSFAVVSAVLLGIYLLLVTASLQVLPDGTDFAVAGSTLAAAALFQPVRRRVQNVVERRFNRASYDADHTATEFSRRLRNEVELDVVRLDLLGVVHQTLQPSSATLWLRTGDR